MMFNTDTCKSLHFGNKNVKSFYSLGNELIRADEEEKDIGPRLTSITEVSEVY